ncbi:afadin- and alpha-actinin-binding protein [Clupea harengus]|uniref:Afadin- and alpha-actinin-binding protein n=1 Tax=Clupea harengus TaxID=7950 RepID=A0A6P8F4M6_CLUHA|nr:afadin- and alpha-actinin-binding protein [Clupea harengus]
MAHRQVRRLPMTRRAPQDASVLMSESSPPVNEASQNALLSFPREDRRDRTTTLREQLVERDQHVARLQDALKREREKCGRLQARCGQQVAELRRRELQNNRLKERLLTDKHKDKGPAMEMLNTLPKSLAKKDQAPRATHSEGRREEEALRLILERREAELREAMKLRHAITTLLHTLRTDMEQTLRVILSGQQEEPDSQRLVQSEVVLGDHVTGGVVKEWVRVQNMLNEMHAQGSSTGGTDQEKIIVQLEKELNESQQLIRLQQQLLQDSVTPALPAPLTDSYYLEEWERLQEKQAELDRQRRSFERERQAFTEAAIRLGHERCQFEQQKASLVRQQYLFNSPPVKLSHPNRRVSPAIKISHPDDPMFISLDSLCLATPSSTGSDQSPRSPGHQEVTTPSTPELYSALRLPYPRSVGTPSPTECWREGGTERPHRAPRRRDHDYSF